MKKKNKTNITLFAFRQQTKLSLILLAPYSSGKFVNNDVAYSCCYYKDFKKNTSNQNNKNELILYKPMWHSKPLYPDEQLKQWPALVSHLLSLQCAGHGLIQSSP